MRFEVPIKIRTESGREIGLTATVDTDCEAKVLINLPIVERQQPLPEEIASAPRKYGIIEFEVECSGVKYRCVRGGVNPLRALIIPLADGRWMTVTVGGDDVAFCVPQKKAEEEGNIPGVIIGDEFLYSFSFKVVRVGDRFCLAVDTSRRVTEAIGF